MRNLLEFCPFASKKMVVIGDLLLDHYIVGDVTRISPEAPVPVVNVSREYFTAGGAANVALNLASLGASVAVFGVAGSDDQGVRLESILQNKGVDTQGILFQSDVPTILKSRVLARQQQICRIDRENDVSSYGSRFGSKAMEALEAAIASSDAVIVSDYAKGVIDQSLFTEVAKICERYSRILAVDPKPKSRLNLSGATVLTPNRAEVFELAGVADSSAVQEDSLKLAVKRVYELHGPKNLVVTLGSEGMAIAEGSQILHQLPTVAREVFDVSGAGDTVIATLAYGLAAGLSVDVAAAVANVAAGIVVSKTGTATTSWHEIVHVINTRI